MKRVAIGLLAVMALFAVILSGGAQPHGVQANTPGTTVKPILSCPDVDGVAPVGLFGDIFPVAERYGTHPGDANYHPLYDVKDVNGTIDLFSDIFYVAENFGVNCPAVDLQVAKATKWGIANLPKVNDAAGVAALQALGYYRGSTDVPGQGIHYTKLQNWDGTFNPEAPEGVVYNNGKLGAQLYVVDGGAVGWGGYEATSCCPTTPHGINLEGVAPAPNCTPACSWAGSYDGWHLHYFLCTFHIGLITAVAVPGVSQSSCTGAASGEPVCNMSSPVFPCYRWAMNVGWMGHLWNHELNPNQIPDVGGTNGRFADCVPDGVNYKAFTCPS